LVALWSNLHGSYPLGVLLVAVFLLGALLERLLAGARLPAMLGERRVVLLGVALAASVAAMGANPYGFGLLGYARALVANPIIRLYITEWAPTSVAELTGQLYFTSVVVFVLVGAASRRRLRPTEALLALVAAALGVQSVRAVIWWGMAAAPILARLL